MLSPSICRSFISGESGQFSRLKNFSPRRTTTIDPTQTDYSFMKRVTRLLFEPETKRFDRVAIIGRVASRYL